MRIYMCSERLACNAWAVLFLLCLGSSHAFLPPTSLMSPKTSSSKTSSTHRNCGWLNTRQQQQQFMNPRLQLFRKDDAPKSEETSNGKEGKSSGGGFFDFLSGFGKKNEAAADESKSTPPSKQVNNDSKQEDVAVAVAVAEKEVVTSTATTTETSSSTTTTSSPVDEAPKEVDAAERSRQLKAQAERLRLEAERMDAELTLEKIARLERELAAAQRAKERHQDDDDKDGPNGRTSSKSSDKVEEIQREMEALRAKIRGEKPPAPTVRKAATTSVDQTKPRVMPVETNKPGMTVKIELPSKLPMPGPFSQENFDRICNDLKDSPDFVKKLMANLVELDYENAADINVTEIAVRMEQLERMDLSFSRRPLPEFTDEDIARAKEDIRFNSWYKDVLVMLETDQDRAEFIKSNETELALRALAYEFYMEDKEIEIAKLSPGESFFEGLIEGSIDQTIETLYPKCMRKEGSVEPNLAEVQKLVSDILPKASFVPSERPEKVLGGYIVRGSSRASNGDALIAAIERELSKSQLQDKLNVFYAKDFTMFAKASEKALNSDDMEAVDLDELPPILYVTTRDVARQPRRVALTLVTALGVATSWYLSVYPFLLNNGIMARVDEQITLADSNMAYDLSWLTDLSLPLFISFMGIQVTHEIGHRLAAGLYNTSMSVPTFVPSLVTGITSTVTNFKTPPKNKDAMFDISVAGPLAGIFASLLALTVGSQLTLVSDPSTFPALPLEILRQSALGGGVINFILGDNVLGLPSGVTQAATGMTVALHPVAIAGYFGLVVNALSLLPIGTTDGGRIAMSVFGRAAKLLVGNSFLVALLVVGILGSDLFLFYYAFLLGFQTGNDIPAKNEVDNISFSRTLVAIAAFAVGFLSLVPFQN